MEDPKSQKYLNEQHSDDIAHLKLSKHHRYMVSATKEAKNEGSCSITIWDAAKLCYLRSVTHNQLQKIHCIDITPCENYFLVLGESAYDPYALLFLWEIQSGSLVTNTLY
jgi:WD40 repeat protein